MTNATPTDPTFDPESLRGEVPFRPAESTHDGPDFCVSDAQGRAVVGVRNDAGELLVLVHAEAEMALLPNEIVEDGEWAAAAERAAPEWVGIDVDVETARRVHEIDHYVEGRDERHLTTHNVVFEATPAGEPPENPAVDPDNWEARWMAEVPEYLGDDGPVEADLRLLLE